MTNQQLKAHCEGVIANPQDHQDWVVDMARVALAELSQPASQSENIRHDALCDTNYARGVSHGWNLAQNGDSEGMRKCIESRTTAAMSALAQPASPALKLTEVPPNALVALCEQMYDHRSTGAAVAHDVWQDCIAELRLNAPHTAPIEPICATGGAEWVKVPREPTQKMIDAHMEGMATGGDMKAYRQMLAAADELSN